MIEFKRENYIEKLRSLEGDGRVKVITGPRRSGKSYILFKLFKEDLIKRGIEKKNIIELALDKALNAGLRDVFKLSEFIRESISGINGRKYVFIDEIQLIPEIVNPFTGNKEDKLSFADALRDFTDEPDIDLYVTGSNSKLLSYDVETRSRDRGDEIRVYPLSFKEVMERVYGGNFDAALIGYLTYGGLPRVYTLENDAERENYLIGLYAKTYLKDVIERWRLQNSEFVVGSILKVIASNIGLITNFKRISDIFYVNNRIKVSPETVKSYIDAFSDAFLIEEANRRNLKGNSYIKGGSKYYFEDLGIRNAITYFRQIEKTHLLENLVYMELKRRGYLVDVGIIEKNCFEDGKNRKKQLEVDFVARSYLRKAYVQCVFDSSKESTEIRETLPLMMIPDSFEKILITGFALSAYQNDKGIWFLPLRDFLVRAPSGVSKFTL